MLNFVYKPKPKKYDKHNQHVWQWMMQTKKGDLHNQLTQKGRK
jgi:hypothetical protein